jgi:hypothetical protein
MALLQPATRRWIGYSSLIAFALALIALAGVAYLYSTSVEPVLRNHIAVQERHQKLYFEDVEYLARFNLFKGAKAGARDAGPSLNHRLHWTPAIAGLESGGAPVVTATLRERLLRYRNDWIRQHSKIGKARPDLSLFDDLASFDHWDLEEASPIAQLIAAKRFIPPDSLPQPDTADLIALAKLRLMKGAEERAPLPALRDVRALARLLFTTESMQQALAGIAVLDIERRAYRYYVDEQGLDPQAWEPLDRNFTRRAHRAIQATRGYLYLWTPKDIYTKAFLGADTPPGFCAAVNEAFPAELALRPLLEPHWPIERDYTEAYARLDETFALAERHCRLRYLRSLVQERNFAADLPGPELFFALPYARHLFGMRLSTVGFTGFDAYNALQMHAATATSGAN